MTTVSCLLIEPWHVSWRLRVDRDLKTRPREPTPPSDYIPLGGVVHSGRPDETAPASGAKLGPFAVVMPMGLEYRHGYTTPEDAIRSVA